jgi:hypothetical protein
MAFIYEQLTEEDMEEFELNKALDEFFTKYDDVWEVMICSPYSWVIDREKKIALGFIGTIKEPSWASDYQHITREKIVLFYYQGISYEVRVLMEDEEYRFRTEKPYKKEMYSVVWKFISVFPEPENQKTFKKLLHKVLEVYGNVGENTLNNEYLKELTVELKD